MRFTTPVNAAKSDVEITHKSNIMLLGSCFAQNIGNKLQAYKFNICTNPFGITYNPLSIATILQRIVAGEPFTACSPEILENGENWHSLLHHSDFSRRTKNELLSNINSSLQKAHKHAQTADILIITFGTAYVYTRGSDGMVVNNCHKLPASNFTRKLLSIEEITDSMSKALAPIIANRPGVKILFTVSPIRHLRDGAHDNQLSKATLLLAIEQLQKTFGKNTAYFPSYEIVLDELRDYRFYAEDMAHPSPVAVEYIWEKFAAAYISRGSNALCNAIEEIERALAHKPFDATSNVYKDFVRATLKKIDAVKQQHPYLNFEKEIEQCNTLLNI